MFHVINDERRLSKMEGKTNFSRRLKQFDGLTCLTPTSIFYDTSKPLCLVHLQGAAWKTPRGTKTAIIPQRKRLDVLLRNFRHIRFVYVKPLL